MKWRFSGTAGREKRAFSRAALDVAAVYFLPPFSFQIRAGGLYLLHGLYHCQTASPRVPVSFGGARGNVNSWCHGRQHTYTHIHT